MATFHSDLLVIGSGVAGLNAAIKASDLGTVHLVTKKEDYQSNTNYAQGGIASVLDSHDSFDAHVRDTLQAGAGLCHRDAVELIVALGPEAIHDLMSLGVDFTRGDDGNLELGREGGHSYRRIVHAKDLTGREVESSLLRNARNHPNIEIYQYHFAIDLILDEKRRCWGAWVWDERNRSLNAFIASVTILCSGGCCQVYQHTTNPPIATGDGVAMGFRAGVMVSNMEFIQFHPTAYYSGKEEDLPFLISEAVRGEGAILRAKDGEAFMRGYHPLKELAPRDIVARAIDAEIKQRGDSCCYLDVTHLGLDFFRERFPNISQHCEAQGLDLAKDWIPIIPSAHYMCGGITTDKSGATDIKGLFAVGETSCTGVHGANRLASNSILEALIFSRLALERVRDENLIEPTPDESPMAPVWDAIQPPQEAVRIVNCWHTLRKLMWDYVGIVRSKQRLDLAHKRIKVIWEEVDQYYKEGRINAQLLELRNLLQISDLIVHCAMQRKESRGLHFILDHPDTIDPPMDTLIWRDSNGRPQVKNRPIPQPNS